MIILNIEDLSEEKVLLILHDSDKESFNFQVEDRNKLQDIKTIEEKIKLLKAINTEETRKWSTILEFIKVNGWDGLKYGKKLTNLKDKLKFLYSLDNSDFMVYMDGIIVYKPITNIIVNDFPMKIPMINSWEASLVPYKEAKKILLDMLENIYVNFDGYNFGVYTESDVLRDLYRTFDEAIRFDFIDLKKTLEYHSAIIAKMEIDKIVAEMNQIEDNENIIIDVKYDSEDILKQIAQRYEIKNKALRFFFQTILEKSFIEAMILTYMNFKNIGFYFEVSKGSYFEYSENYPQEFKEAVKKLIKPFLKYKIERAINNLKNNRFEDIIVDDNGNIIDIDAIQERFELIYMVDFEGPKIILYRR
jgi:hypothetical protein